MSIAQRRGLSRRIAARYRRDLLGEEWNRVEAAPTGGPERLNMAGAERRLLYLTALQTGLRSGELQIVTRRDLFIDADLAADLRAHTAVKSPSAPLFAMPHKTEVAERLREDSAEARRLWLREAINDADECAQRLKSDFLAADKHDPTAFLRHSCGKWPACKPRSCK